MKWSKRTWNPAIFQGADKTGHYFEGWYFKCVSKDGVAVYAIIPGIALGHTTKDHHAFIQVINGRTAASHFFTFPFESFHYDDQEFRISIGENRFSLDGLTLALLSDELQLEGSLSFHEQKPYPSRLLSPGIMGWYSFAPFMECYHGVVSMDHAIEGSLFADGIPVDFTGSRGYCEKDWGRSFPSSWIWMQSNHFTTRSSSFMFSLARIPWLGTSFPGFLSFLLHDGAVTTIATYTGASVRSISMRDDSCTIIIEDRRHLLEITAHRAAMGVLRAPANGMMERRIHEAIAATISIDLHEKKTGAQVFHDTGLHAGLEIVGTITELLPAKNK